MGDLETNEVFEATRENRDKAKVILMLELFILVIRV